MGKKRDGGSAFPQVYLAIASGKNVTLDATHPSDMPPGMSVRDYFAGLALQGMLSNQFIAEAAVRMERHDPSYFAVAAYEHADAMLLERGGAGEEAGLSLVVEEGREWWVNVYPGREGNSGPLMASREQADKQALPDRIDCLHLREVVTGADEGRQEA